MGKLKLCVSDKLAIVSKAGSEFRDISSQVSEAAATDLTRNLGTAATRDDSPRVGLAMVVRTVAEDGLG